MDASSCVRRHQCWLALVTMVLCLPWLATAGSRRCGWLTGHAAVIAKTSPAPGCCSHCVATTGDRQLLEPTPPPKKAGFCCAAFEAYLTDYEAGSKVEGFELQNPWQGALPLFGSTASASADADAASVRANAWTEAAPPDAFLHTVVRRCFPSHAPPFAADQLG